jgi:hypothetical protein
MAKRNNRAATNRKLEALMRSQKMSEILKIGEIQSQALLDSAGETRPSDESHVVELLDRERFTRSEMSRGGSKSRAKPLHRAHARQKAKPKRAKRR